MLVLFWGRFFVFTALCTIYYWIQFTLCATTRLRGNQCKVTCTIMKLFYLLTRNVRSVPRSNSNRAQHFHTKQRKARAGILARILFKLSEICLTIVHSPLHYVLSLYLYLSHSRTLSLSLFLFALQIVLLRDAETNYRQGEWTKLIDRNRSMHRPESSFSLKS